MVGEPAAGWAAERVGDGRRPAETAPVGDGKRVITVKFPVLGVLGKSGNVAFCGDRNGDVSRYMIQRGSEFEISIWVCWDGIKLREMKKKF